MIATPAANIDIHPGRSQTRRRQLERVFRAELGVSPWQYALGRRLQQGHWPLTRSERSITDIAQECGFADASHFARRMRASFGAPPQVLRDAGLAAARAESAAP